MCVVIEGRCMQLTVEAAGSQQRSSIHQADVPCTAGRVHARRTIAHLHSEMRGYLWQLLPDVLFELPAASKATQSRNFGQDGQ